MNARVRWIDVVKCFGIFAIYLGHCADLAGNAYGFVTTHHVALFFFISGCTECLNKEQAVVPYITKKVKTVLLPFYVFAGASIIIFTILHNSDLNTIKVMLVTAAKGVICGQFIAGSLWFLTCLFVVQVIFAFIKKLNNKGLIFAVCMIIYLVRNLDIFPDMSTPSWYYNLDSALFWLIYYALGYIAFPHIKNLLELDTKKKKVFVGVSGSISFLYSALLFQKIDLLERFYGNSMSKAIASIIMAGLVIWLYFVVARLCQDISVFAKIGQNTLYLCGSEYIVKTILTCMLELVGLSLTISNPLAAYIYCASVLVISNRFFVPPMKKLMKIIIK